MAISMESQGWTFSQDWDMLDNRRYIFSCAEQMYFCRQVGLGINFARLACDGWLEDVWKYSYRTLTLVSAKHVLSQCRGQANAFGSRGFGAEKARGTERSSYLRRAAT